MDLDHSDAFVGYAPVLDAVVALLADGNLIAVENTFAADGLNEDRTKVLLDVIESLLEREHGKVASLSKELGLNHESAYSADEQLDWLAADWRGATPPALTWCAEEVRGEYASQIQEFLRDHPFRSEQDWASPVFAAFVAARRFDARGLRRSLVAIGNSTGLLFEFVARLGNGDLLDEWQFSALHASLLSAEWLDAEASVAVLADGAESDGSEVTPVEQAATELVLLEDQRPAAVVQAVLALESPGELIMRAPASAVSVDFPGSVELRSMGASISLGPDCFIRCMKLTLAAETVELSRRSESSGDDTSLVTLEVLEDFDPEATLTGSPPISALEIRVPMEASLGYPWVNYRAALEPKEAPPNERAVRLLNMIMNLARNHGRKEMALFDKKLEGRQSVKGEELSSALKVLEDDGVVLVRGSMIVLTKFAEENRFSGKARAGLATLDDVTGVWRPVVDHVASSLRK